MCRRACVRACVRVFQLCCGFGVNTSVIRGGFTVTHVTDIVCSDLYPLTALRARPGALPKKRKKEKNLIHRLLYYAVRP